MRMLHAAGGVAAAFLLVACGGDELGGGGANGDGSAGPNVITIRDFAFEPADLRVPPGTTVTVRNLDGEPHTVTSQSAPGQYVAGEVDGISFDTGPFTSVQSFTIPGNAQPGTVIPYFCSVHRADMVGDGQITIVAPPSVSPGS